MEQEMKLKKKHPHADDAIAQLEASLRDLEEGRIERVR